jgi:hypothetical protein
LKTSGNIISVQADSPEEALAFVYAAIDAGEPNFREHFLARKMFQSLYNLEQATGKPPVTAATAGHDQLPYEPPRWRQQP